MKKFKIKIMNGIDKNKCWRCGKIPRELLSLSCQHNICLDCAIKQPKEFDQTPEVVLQRILYALNAEQKLI